ncbi:MarR family transcriptional regulator [Nocardiopsis exhalans]|uniref:MarR family winged helix-turn-helix transcriptional regulator n=1 Tax=Nocardiopsis exhalans TaxID=163604 RepID=UPI0031D440F8
MSDAADWETPLWHRTGFRLIKLGELVQATTARLFESFEINSRQYHVLSAAAALGTPSQKELSRVLGVDPNVMVGLVDDLESRGLAERVRNPEDRRRYIVTPTDRARQLLEQCDKAVSEVEKALFEELSEPERRQLHEVSGRMLTSNPRVTKHE